MRKERKAHRSLSDKVAAKAANRQNGRNHSSYLLLPDGVEMFRPRKEGNYRFNIVPYVAGKNNRDTEQGELDYEFTFYVHKIGDGDDQRTIVCPKKTYGKPCPVCEQVERLSKNYVENEDEIKSMKAKQRQLFNIVDARDEENRIQVYETSYFKSFGELLDKRLRNFEDEDDDENYGNFADIPGGRTLKVMFAEDTFNGNKFFAPSSIDFVTRKEELPDSIIDEAVCLDSCLKVLEYNDILKLIAGTDDGDEEEQIVEKHRPQRAKPAKPAVEESEDEDEEEDQEEEKKPVKPVKSKSKPKKVEEPEDDEDDDEDEEEDVKPTKSSKSKKPAKSSEDEDDDEDVDDDEEDEEDEKKPVKSTKSSKSKKAEEPAKSKSKKGKCPHGYAWGADCYVYSECDECELCDECDAAQDEK